MKWRFKRQKEGKLVQRYGLVEKDFKESSYMCLCVRARVGGVTQV